MSCRDVHYIYVCIKQTIQCGTCENKKKKKTRMKQNYSNILLLTCNSLEDMSVNKQASRMKV